VSIAMPWEVSAKRLGPDLCWEWAGPRDQRGRPVLTHQGRQIDLQQLAAGTAPAHSTCRSHDCINPAHLTTEAPAAALGEEALIREHLGMVDREVTITLKRLPRHVDKEDLISVGVAALINCARRFEPARGVPFGAYAKRRVQGAILDELRSQDWLSRGDRRRIKDGTVPEPSGALVAPLRLDVESEDGYALTETIVDARPGPEQLLLNAERDAELLAAVEQLPDRLRVVVERICLREEPIELLAGELGLSQSRVSQLKTEAYAWLRNHVQTPSAVVEDSKVSREQRYRYLIEDVDWLLETGSPIHDIPRRVGVSGRTIARVYQRVGRPAPVGIA